METMMIEKALENAFAKVRRNATRFGASFPPDAGINLDYSPDLGDNTWWTTGFWMGLLWLTAQVTGWGDVREYARALGLTFDRRLHTGINIDHDLGMLFMPSRALEYRLTGDPVPRQSALEAASVLASRFREPGGYIQAWGSLDDPTEAGRTIIDSMMNIPLLFWAYRETGTDTFLRMAVSHASTVGRYLIRGDGSSYHTFFFDPASGEPIGGHTHQGHADGSTWARGQAWGIYGFTLAYRLSGDSRLAVYASSLADYFLQHLPNDSVCYWDLDISNPEEPRDTSAASIAVCGLLELAQCTTGSDNGRYQTAAYAIADQLIKCYLAPPDKEGLLAEAVANLPKGHGIRECTIYGDYFYLEALVRLGGRNVILPWL